MNPHKKERKKEYDRAYGAANREHKRLLLRDWQAANRAHVRAYARARNKAHPDSRRRSYLKWALANPEAAAAARSAWDKAHPEGARRRRRLYADAHPEMVINSRDRRRARECGVGFEPVSAVHLRLLFNAQNGRCLYCQKILTKKNRNLDHRTPLSRGGPHAPHNLAWACARCNNKKNTKTVEEFLTWLRAKEDVAGVSARAWATILRQE